MTPSRTDDDDEHALARPGPGRASAIQGHHAGGSQPSVPIWYGPGQPVDLLALDPAVVRRLIEQPSRIAQDIVCDGDDFQLRQMGGAAVDMILDGRAAAGIARKGFVERSKVGQGHLRQRLAPPWHELSAAAIHAMFALENSALAYQEITSVGARIKRSHHGLGADQVHNCTPTLHMLVRSLAGHDRHCPVDARPLVTGTCWDSRSNRYDRSKAERFGELGYPETLAETVGATISDHLSLRSRLGVLLTSRPELFDEDLRKRLIRSMPSLFLIGRIDCGPPSDRKRLHGMQVWPGRDQELVQVLKECGVRAVLACGPAVPGDVDPQKLEERPLRAGSANAMLGITSMYGVSQRLDSTRSLLLRTSAEAGVRQELWRLVGMDGAEDSIALAQALVERQAQCSWPARCVARWAADCGPAQLKAYQPAICSGLIDALNVANAAIVAADRREQRDRILRAAR